MKNKYVVFRIVRFIVKPIFKLYYNPKIIGKENIPLKEGIIIAGNHKHTFDQFGIMVSTKRVIHYMAKKEYFDGTHSLFCSHYNPTKIGRMVTKWLVRMSGCISVDRNIKDTDAMGNAAIALNEGEAIGLFPEGTRNKTTELLLPFKFGTVSLASKTKAYIVPFAITGDYVFRSKNLTIRIGQPFKIDNMSLEEANDKLYNEIKSLMKENLKEQ